MISSSRLGGGTIGGTKSSIEKWHKKYYENFRLGLDVGKFVGKDQVVMATTCLETDLCLLGRVLVQVLVWKCLKSTLFDMNHGLISWTDILI